MRVKEAWNRLSKNRTARWIAIAVLILLVVMIVLDPLSVRKGLPTEKGEIGDDMIVNISEQDDTVIVTTAYGKIKYPFAFSDVVLVVPMKYEDYVSFEFHGRMENGEYLLYTLWIGKEQGRPMGFVTDRSGNRQEVYFEMAEEPRGLKESDKNTFYAAQETANDVLGSFITQS